MPIFCNELFQKDNKNFLISSKNSIFAPLWIKFITSEFIAMNMNIVQVTGYRIQGTGSVLKNVQILSICFGVQLFLQFHLTSFFLYWLFNELFFIQHFFDCYGLLPRRMLKKIAVVVKILWLLCHSATVFFIMYSYSSVKLNRWLYKFKDFGCRNFESVSKCRK